MVQLIKGIFFHIDDTLYNSTKLATMARRNSIQAMIDTGIDLSEDVLYSKLSEIIQRFGSNYTTHYDELLKSFNIEWNPRIIAAGVVAYEHTKSGYLRPFPGTIPTLLKLRNDHKLAIISNGFTMKQWEKLIGLGIDHFFDLVTTSEDLGFDKPQKEIFEYSMKELNLKSEECIMVGDRLDTDIMGGNRSGMITVLVKTGKFDNKPRTKEEKPDFEINSISELLTLVKKI